MNPRPRDKSGRFLPVDPKTRPWGILLTNSRELGHNIRAVPRLKRNKTTLSTKRAIRFASEQEARAYLTTEVKRVPGWYYIVAML